MAGEHAPPEQVSYIDSDSCVTRAVTATATGLVTGSIAGAVKANWSDVPPVLRNRPWPALKRTGEIMGQFGATFALVGATFAAASCAAEKYRGKKDNWNGVLGGVAAGAAVGARTHNPTVGIAGGFMLAACSLAVDVSGGQFRGTGVIDDGATPRKQIFPYPWSTP